MGPRGDIDNARSMKYSYGVIVDKVSKVLKALASRKKNNVWAVHGTSPFYDRTNDDEVLHRR